MKRLIRTLCCITLLLACALPLNGCLLLALPNEADEQESAEIVDTTASNQSSAIERAMGEMFAEQLELNRIDLADSPLTGEYLTTSGVELTLAADGEYRWLEPDGSLIIGTYTVSAGTMSAEGYVFESDTGKLYTVFVELQTEGEFEPGQLKPSVDISILVFDEYDSTTWRVSELLANIQFEARVVE